MLSFDIPVNINLTANTEEEAEEIISQAMAKLIAGAALQRAINSWDFIEFVEEEDPVDANTTGV